MRTRATKDRYGLFSTVELYDGDTRLAMSDLAARDISTVLGTSPQLLPSARRQFRIDSC